MRLLVSGGTKTLKRLAGIYPDHLGCLLTPNNGNSVDSIVETGLPWACDNACFSGFNPDAFWRMLARAQGKPGCEWVVCPDVVGDAKATIEHWWHAEEICWRGFTPAFVLQDGQENLPLPWAQVYFLGGTDNFKLSNAAVKLCLEAKRRKAWLHIGRVNTLKRLAFAHAVGADSVDGYSMNRFGDTYLEKFVKWIRHLEYHQPCFPNLTLTAPPRFAC